MSTIQRQVKMGISHRAVRATYPFLLGGLLLALAFVFLFYRGQLVRSAPHSTCFADVFIPGWLAGNLAVGNVGASRPLTPGVPGEVELCSATAGFADVGDDDRYLVKRTISSFQFDAAVLSVDSTGFGGIVARWDTRTLDGAHIHIGVVRRGDSYFVRSSVRLDNGAAIGDGGTSLVAVSLPVSLRMVRDGNSFITAYAANGNPFVDHLTVDGTGHDIAREQLAVGLNQASEDAAVSASTVFDRFGFVTPDTAPADVQACFGSFPLQLSGGETITVSGHNLQEVTGLTVAGVPATIQTQSGMTLTVVLSTSLFIQSGPILFEWERELHPTGDSAIYAGVPYVRGDLDGDETVDGLDRSLLQDYLNGDFPDLGCLETADVNGDGPIDADDLSYLDAYLAGTGLAPPAPFPAPGYAPGGGRTCGLPPVPRISGLFDAANNPVDDTSTLAEGDRLFIRGARLPAADMAYVLFDNVPAHVLAGSSRELQVEIGAVPNGGNKCPIVMADTTIHPPPPDYRGSSPGSRLIHAYGVLPTSSRSDLCPGFAPSSFVQYTAGTYDPATHSLFLPFPPETWIPEEPIHLQIRYFWPLLDGISRGSQYLETNYQFVSQPTVSHAVAPGGGMILGWEATEGAARYEIHRDRAPYFTPTTATLLATVAATGTLGYTDSAGLTAGPDALYYGIIGRDNPGRPFFSYPLAGYHEFPVAAGTASPSPLAAAAAETVRSYNLFGGWPSANEPPTYAEWLGALAAHLGEELNGGQDPACGCDVQVAADPVAGGITISPCNPVLSGWLEPGPDPGYEPEFPLQPNPGPLTGASWWAQPTPTCEAVSDTDVRLNAWCRLQEIVETSAGTGLPIWESYIPLHNALQGFPGLETVLPPNQRTPDEKEVMFSSDAFDAIVALGYIDPCTIAARGYYCASTGLEGYQMPKLPDGPGVVKTFWLAASKLPASADPADYYSYQPPAGERQYLAGMHVLTGSNGWATCWVPKPAGDSLANDGSPLQYNDFCTVGHGNDQPVELGGVWANFVMCAQAAAGEENCGNPWGPPDECRMDVLQDFGSCSGCHYQATFAPDIGAVGMDLGGLPTLVDIPDAESCYQLIVLSNALFPEEELYKEKAPAICTDD